MGIHKLFSYLETRELVVLYDKPRNKTNHALFIDGTNIFGFYSQFSQNGKNSFCCVKDLIIRFIPAGFVYIAMDGKSPEQKILNQRRKKKQAQNLVVDDQLIAEEEYYGQSFIEFGVEINCEIHYDGRDREGEAEQKIIRRIREQISKGELQKNQKHYVISNDNDVIVLLLQFVDYDFSVIKINFDEKTNQPTYYVVDIQKVRDYFIARVHHICGMNDFLIERTTNDIIFLSFFLGNDYVECFKEIDECEDAFDIMIDSYCQMNSSRSCPYRYLTDGPSFINANLKCFISILITKLKNWQEKQKKNRNSKPQSKIQSYHKTKTAAKKNVKPNFNPFQRAEAGDMIKALRWTLLYYLYEIPSWKYQYPILNNITLNDFGLLIDVPISSI